MERGQRRVLAGVLWALASWGCEHGVTLGGTITTPVEVQRLFSRSERGLVRVSVSIPKTSVPSYRAAVLCEPGTAPLVIPFSHDGFGCAKQGVVQVDVLRVTADDREAPCGVGQISWQGQSTATPVASGQQLVFEGATGDVGCSSGSAAIDVVLRLSPPR